MLRRDMNNKIDFLYIGDLNLEHGGAQRHTFYTLKCIAREFNVLMYIVGEPSQESLRLIRDLKMDYVIVKNFSYNHLKIICKHKKVRFLLVQWENPQWIIAAYKISREMGIPYILLMHELPILGTPTKIFIRNFLLEYIIKLLTKIIKWHERFSAFESFIANRVKITFADDRKLHFYLDTIVRLLIRIRKFITNIYRVFLVYRGVCCALNILAVSPVSAYYVQTYFPVSEKILTLKIPNGVDTRYIDGWEKEEDFKYDIGFMAARLVPEKGIIDLLEIIHKVQQKIKNDMGKEIKVAILGCFINEYIKQLFLRKAKELNIIKNIDILGYLSEDEKFKVLRSMRLFLYPSIKDCFSISFIEAMACGCPSVVYDLPFTKQFRTEAMFKIRYRDLHTMANIVCKLIMLSHTQPTEFLSLRKSTINFARQFKWDEVCKNETLILKHIINNYNINADGGISK